MLLNLPILIFPSALLLSFVRIWALFVLLGFYLLTLIIKYANIIALHNLTNQRTIEFNELVVKISKKNKEVEVTHELLSTDKVICTKEYKMPINSISGLISEIRGKAAKNYMVFIKKGHSYRYDFEFDSYYMIKQLNELMDIWVKNGVVVDRAELLNNGLNKENES